MDFFLYMLGWLGLSALALSIVTLYIYFVGLISDRQKKRQKDWGINEEDNE